MCNAYDNSIYLIFSLFISLSYFFYINLYGSSARLGMVWLIRMMDKFNAVYCWQILCMYTHIRAPAQVYKPTQVAAGSDRALEPMQTSNACIPYNRYHPYAYTIPISWPFSFHFIRSFSAFALYTYNIIIASCITCAGCIHLWSSKICFCSK